MPTSGTNGDHRSGSPSVSRMGSIRDHGSIDPRFGVYRLGFGCRLSFPAESRVLGKIIKVTANDGDGCIMGCGLSLYYYISYVPFQASPSIADTLPTCCSLVS